MTMPLMLRDRVGIFALFPIFFINIAVSTATVILYRFFPTLAVVLAWVYMYVLLLQTRLMAVLLVSGWIVTPLIAHFTDAITMFQSVYAMGIFTATTVAAHLVAVFISALTGFRI